MTRKRSPTSKFSTILTSLMKEKKITVREAANIAGVAKSTIDNWRSGAMPEDFLAVKKLAKALLAILQMKYQKIIKKTVLIKILKI